MLSGFELCPRWGPLLHALPGDGFWHYNSKLYVALKYCLVASTVRLLHCQEFLR